MATKTAPPATAHVALLRGINVAGKNMLPMKDLAELFADAGCRDVRTYIQSGNVLFGATPAVVTGLFMRIEKQIEKRFGLRVPVIVRSAEAMAGLVASNPFLKAGVDERFLHVFFLAVVPREADVALLDPDRSPPDRFAVTGREIYAHTPDGLGRSKLTNAYFDARLKTVSTARNWNTVVKLSGMMAER